MATIRKKEGSHKPYHVQVRKHGWPQQTKSFMTKKSAEAWAKTIESEMERGIFLSRTRAEKITLEQVIDRYELEILPSKKGKGPDKSRLITLRDELGKYRLAALTPVTIAGFRDARLRQVSKQSVRHELSLLNRLLKYALMELGIALPGGIPTEQIRKPTLPRGRERRLKPGELEPMLAASQSRVLRAIVLLALESAMRRGEMAALKWKDVDLDNNKLRVSDSKNGESREIPLSKTAVKILQDLKASSTRYLDGSVFGTRADSITQAFIRARDRAREAYENECKEAKKKPDDRLLDLRLHDARHEATSRLAEKLSNVLELSAVTGHKDLRMLKRYYHPRAEDLAKKLG